MQNQKQNHLNQPDFFQTKIIYHDIVKKNFSKAAKNYQESAIIQKIAAEKLTDFSANYIKPHSSIIDLGSGTGFVAKFFNKNHFDKNYLIYQSDLSEEMLAQNYETDQQRFCFDIAEVSKIDIRFDAISSSFCFQWLNNYQSIFENLKKILKPKGVLAISVPAFNSLIELREASIHSNCNFDFVKLPEFEKFGELIEKSGFERKFLKKEIELISFKNGFEALKNIKKFGGNYHNFSKKNEENLNQKKIRNISKKQLAEFNNFCFKNYSDLAAKKENLYKDQSINSDCQNIKISWEIGYFIYQKID
jgi:malonyl-CoA O-methyltransferase